MADTQWFIEGIQVDERAEREYFVEGVQVQENQAEAPPEEFGGVSIVIGGGIIF